METFRWKPDKAEIKITQRFESLVSDLGTGPEQRITTAGPLREWELTFKKARREANEIWGFYTERRGSYETFLFVCPHTGQNYTVRFADNNLSRAVFWRQVYEFGLRITEVKP